jgi:hypothetical protein
MPFCRQCGKEITQDTRFCPNCGTEQISYVMTPPFQAGLETKDTGLTALIALILGIFGVWGVGHIYVEKLARGIALMILGILLVHVLGLALFFSVLFFAYSSQVNALIGSIILWLAIIIGIFIWQIYDAYNLAKYYNRYIKQYRKPPW